MDVHFDQGGVDVDAVHRAQLDDELVGQGQQFRAGAGDDAVPGGGDFISRHQPASLLGDLQFDQIALQHRLTLAGGRQAGLAVTTTAGGLHTQVHAICEAPVVERSAVWQHTTVDQFRHRLLTDPDMATELGLGGHGYNPLWAP